MLILQRREEVITREEVDRRIRPIVWSPLIATAAAFILVLGLVIESVVLIAIACLVLVVLAVLYLRAVKFLAGLDELIRKEVGDGACRRIIARRFERD